MFSIAMFQYWHDLLRLSLKFSEKKKKKTKYSGMLITGIHSCNFWNKHAKFSVNIFKNKTETVPNFMKQKISCGISSERYFGLISINIWKP